jgi:hypothetical protein
MDTNGFVGHYALYKQAKRRFLRMAKELAKSRELVLTETDPVMIAFLAAYQTLLDVE